MVSYTLERNANNIYVDQLTINNSHTSAFDRISTKYGGLKRHQKVENNSSPKNHKSVHDGKHELSNADKFKSLFGLK